MDLGAREIAGAMGARIVVEGGEGTPARAAIDSSASGTGDLFFGLRGARVDGGKYAPAALEAGAWEYVPDASE